MFKKRFGCSRRTARSPGHYGRLPVRVHEPRALRDCRVQHGRHVVLNDATLPLLARTAVSHAAAGADLVARAT